MRSRIDSSFAGWRLDKVLVKILPDVGLRTARRLVENNYVLLNGKFAKCAQKVHCGELLEIIQPEQEEKNPGVFKLGQRGDFVFFHKPAGLHSVSLAGSAVNSLERIAAKLAGAETFRLLQRLDFGTSGIVAAALSDAAEREFRRLEAAGLCHKYYLALLAGAHENVVCACNAIDTSRGRRVHVLPDLAPASRHTVFSPVCIWQQANEIFGHRSKNSGPVTLAICEIKRGMRHQIRAHAAYLGMPLLGDSLYGNASEDQFILEHFHLKFGDLEIVDNCEKSFLSCLPNETKVLLETRLASREIACQP